MRGLSRFAVTRLYPCLAFRAAQPARLVGDLEIASSTASRFWHRDAFALFPGPGWPRQRVLAERGFDNSLKGVRAVEIDDINGIMFPDAVSLQSNRIPDDAHDPFIGGDLFRVGHGPIVMLPAIEKRAAGPASLAARAPTSGIRACGVSFQTPAAWYGDAPTTRTETRHATAQPRFPEIPRDD